MAKSRDLAPERFQPDWNEAAVLKTLWASSLFNERFYHRADATHGDIARAPDRPDDRPEQVMEFAVDLIIDITKEFCPMTFVRTRLALDRMASGQILRVDLRGEEPRQNVPRSAVELGHAVLAEQTSADGITSVVIRKA